MMLSPRTSGDRLNPSGLHRPLPARARAAMGADSPFAGEQKRSIETELSRRGLSLRSPTLEDLPALADLQRQAFPSFRPEQLMNHQTLYRLIEFGDPAILQDAAGDILGYHLVFHLNDRARTAISCGLGIDERLRGIGAGTLLYRHSALRALEAGARHLKATVKSTNFPSLSLLLNKMGGVCDRFHYRLGPLRHCRFRHSCHLSAGHLQKRPIDLEKLADFTEGSVRGLDFQQIDPADAEAIEEMYDHTSMRVMAIAPPDVLADETRLFAVPAEALEDLRAELTKGPA